jgi:hypothetical protein
MKLSQFITQFSHNNIIRLVYKTKQGHQLVANHWNDVSMDWEVNKKKGIFRHYANNEVLGITSISFTGRQGIHYPEAINIVIEKLENQPTIEEAQTQNEFITEAR